MKTKKWISLILALFTLLNGLAFASESETTAHYQLGDKPADFTVTMSDGQEVSLYGLLAEKDVVMLNFWASWCGPCRMEFPFLQEAYAKLSDKVGVIALSVFEGDTNEAINDLKEELGLTTLPMGRDIGLKDQYNVPAFPTTIIIDRNGVICMEHTGMITSTRLLVNALETFIGDDYTESVLLGEMPALPLAESGDAKALSDAANIPGGTLELYSLVDEADNLPFIPSEEGDCAVASNLDAQNTVANLALLAETQPGDVLVYEYQLKGLTFDDRIVVFAQDEAVNIHAIQTDGWVENAVRVTEEGVDRFTFLFVKGSQGGYDVDCRIRNVRLLTGDEAAEYVIPEVTGPKVLSGVETAIEYEDDSVEPVYLYQADGVRSEDNGSYLMATKNEVGAKVLVGEDVNLNLAAIRITRDIMNTEYIMLSSLPCDDEGYIFTCDMASVESGAVIVVLPNAAANVNGNSDMVFNSADGLKTYMKLILSMVITQATPEEFTELAMSDAGYYGLEDGTLVLDMNSVIAETWEEAKKDAEEEQAQDQAYVVKFTDPDGNPIQGVLAQFCDDTTCSVIISDENGEARFEGDPYPYNVHVLMVPAGYESVSENFDFTEQGGEIAITLNPLEF
ncbi:MAG: TlpA disulfide reductase family protein [Clostridia bacterium]|nr:TlpA disulfide reductase family protein [Clostridia bacterium]